MTLNKTKYYLCYIQANAAPNEKNGFAGATCPMSTVFESPPVVCKDHHQSENNKRHQRTFN
jgi:hypothetical protein